MRGNPAFVVLDAHGAPKSAPASATLPAEVIAVPGEASDYTISSTLSASGDAWGASQTAPVPRYRPPD